MDLKKYRESPSEKERLADLFRLIPSGNTVLDIGARDGHISRLLTERFNRVTALDLVKPAFEFDRVETVQGDVTQLQFPDCTFDVVFCSEVLEHIPPRLLPQACREIARVARYEVLIGVPFRQDLRVGRTTCLACGAHNPAWAHLNSFDEAKLKQLFAPLQAVQVSFVGTGALPTNAVSAWLMNLAGNPWGNYSQEEPCVSCGQPLQRPEQIPLHHRVMTSGAFWLAKAMNLGKTPEPMWIHCLYRKQSR